MMHAMKTSDEAGALETLGRSSGPASLILSSLAGGAKHGYALTKDIEQFAGVRLAPGTLYEALSTYLQAQRKVADVGLDRLAGLRAPT